LAGSGRVSAGSGLGGAEGTGAHRQRVAIALQEHGLHLFDSTFDGASVHVTSLGRRPQERDGTGGRLHALADQSPHLADEVIDRRIGPIILLLALGHGPGQERGRPGQLGGLILVWSHVEI
jgi:hypothetical protein